MMRKVLFLSFAFSTYSGTFSGDPISSNISKQAWFAPPWAGPHREAIPADTQAKGFAKELPVSLTVEVEAFYSWSAWRIRIFSRASVMTGGI